MTDIRKKHEALRAASEDLCRRLNVRPDYLFDKPSDLIISDVDELFTELDEARGKVERICEWRNGVMLSGVATRADIARLDEILKGE